MKRCEEEKRRERKSEGKVKGRKESKWHWNEWKRKEEITAIFELAISFLEDGHAYYCTIQKTFNTPPRIHINTLTPHNMKELSNFQVSIRIYI
jgi:hypothetical protein